MGDKTTITDNSGYKANNNVYIPNSHNFGSM